MKQIKSVKGCHLILWQLWWWKGFNRQRPFWIW